MIAARLAAFVEAISFDSLPPEVVESVRRRMLDTLGLMLAGHGCPASRAASAVAGGGADGDALVGGTAAHALDFDDTHLPSLVHPSCVIVPTALAAGAHSGASGRDVIAAAAAGYEIVVRLGCATYDAQLGNTLLFERGFHPTSVCGTVAASAVAAKLLGLRRTEIEAALTVSASTAAGLLEANRTGGTVKPFHAGWAARSGLAAARLAAAGMTGPTTAFEGRFGFFYAFCGEAADVDSATASLAEVWLTPDIHVKPYPANHFTHAGIDAARLLRAGHRLDRTAIEHIELRVPAPALRTIGEPIDVKRHPPTGYAARFSGPHTVAVALLGGTGLGLGHADVTDARAADPAVRQLAARVRCCADAELESLFPRSLPATVELTLTDGTRLRRTVTENRGGLQWPLSEAELAVKLSDNLSQAGRISELERLTSLCERLDTLERVSALARYLRGSPQGC